MVLHVRTLIRCRNFPQMGCTFIMDDSFSVWFLLCFVLKEKKMKKIFLHFQVCSICNRSDGLRRPRIPIILLVLRPCFRYRVCLLKVQFACESNHTLRGRYNVLSGMQPYYIIQHGGWYALKEVVFCASPGSAEVN